MSFSRPSARCITLLPSRSRLLPPSAHRFNSSLPPLPSTQAETSGGKAAAAGEVAPIPSSSPSSLGSSSSSSSNEAIGRHRPPAPSKKEGVTQARAQFRRLAAVLTVVVFSACGYAIKLAYDLEKLFTVWPPELRDDLRNALRDEGREEWPKAEGHWRTAYQKALSPEIRPKLSLLHITGLASSYVDLLLTHALAPQRARPVLLSALDEIDSSPLPLTGPERQRRIAILSKLGEVAEKLKRVDEEELYLTKALEDSLRAVVQARKFARSKIEEQGGNTAGWEDLPMPGWLSRTDVAVCCDNLARYYVRTGNGDYASALYLHAINVTYPPTDPGSLSTDVSLPPLDDRCRAAQLMTQLANSLVVRPSSDNLATASIWGLKALQTIEAAHQSPELLNLRGNPDLTPEEEETKKMCDRVMSVSLFNLGVLASMEGKLDEAKAHLNDAIKHSARIGYRVGSRNAEAVLGQVDAKERARKAGRG
ncbi:hypothetical protein BDY24DRAFT_403201 [Mrakia frigida]|uniref:uncharacterized protein n=1 Tax=Mrakia frigida TaxID=29902 RepID=UPI003FCC01A7